MNIIFLSHYFDPHIGGVEKHVYEIAKRLSKKGNKVSVLTEKYDKNLKIKESIEKINIFRIYYPHIKVIGIVFIWWKIFSNRKLIQEADIIHIHDVFIWYVPFKFLYPNKRVYTTFHGWETIWPISWKNIFMKRLAAKLSTATIVVGKYIERYYGIKACKIIYGAK